MPRVGDATRLARYVDVLTAELEAEIAAVHRHADAEPKIILKP